MPTKKCSDLYTTSSTPDDVSCGLNAIIDDKEFADYIFRLNSAVHTAKQAVRANIAKQLFECATFEMPGGGSEKVSMFDIFSLGNDGLRKFSKKFCYTDLDGKSLGFCGKRPDGTRFTTTASFAQYAECREMFSNDNSPFGHSFKNAIIATLPAEFSKSMSAYFNEGILNKYTPYVGSGIRKTLDSYDAASRNAWTLTDDERAATPSVGKNNSGARKDRTWERAVRNAVEQVSGLTLSKSAVLSKQMLVFGPQPHQVANKKAPVCLAWPDSINAKVNNEVVCDSVPEPKWTGVFKKAYLAAIELYKAAVIENLPSADRGGLLVTGSFDFTDRDKNIKDNRTYDSVFVTQNMPGNGGNGGRIRVQTRSRHAKAGYYPENVAEAFSGKKQAIFRNLESGTPEMLMEPYNGMLLQVPFKRPARTVRFAGPTELDEAKVVGIDVNSALFKINTSIKPTRKCGIFDWHEAIHAFMESRPDAWMFNFDNLFPDATGVTFERCGGSMLTSQLIKFKKQLDEILLQYTGNADGRKHKDYAICLFPVLGIPAMAEGCRIDPLVGLRQFVKERKTPNGKPHYTDTEIECVSHTFTWRRKVASLLSEKLDYCSRQYEWQRKHPDPVKCPYVDQEALDRMDAIAKDIKQIEEHVYSKSILSTKMAGSTELYSVEKLDFNGLCEGDTAYRSLSQTLRSIETLRDRCRVKAQDASGTATVIFDDGKVPDGVADSVRKWFKSMNTRLWALKRISKKPDGTLELKAELTEEGKFERRRSKTPYMLTKLLHLPDVKHVVGRLGALRGVPVIEVDPKYTSLTCNKCGKRSKGNACKKGANYCDDKNIPFRQGELFKCPCGNVTNANFNSALNVRDIGIRAIANMGRKKGR